MGASQSHLERAQVRIQGVLLGVNPWRARERQPIMGVGGRSPQWGPEAKPLVTGRGAKPPKLTTF